MNYLCYTDGVKLLNGAELADYIQERQAKQVRALRQAHGVAPKLAIVRTNLDPVVDSYMKLKQRYGTDILIDVIVVTVPQTEAIETIHKLNKDDGVHGIVVQIPLPDTSQTDEILNEVAPEKDVDGLGKFARLDPATPLAIDWLLAGYNIDLRAKNLLIVGNGRLVGKPLAERWQSMGLEVVVADSQTKNLAELIKEADVLVTATDMERMITKDMVKPKAVIVDVSLVGNVAAGVRELTDITITPEKDGVDSLAVCALFDNVIRAARETVKND